MNELETIKNIVSAAIHPEEYDDSKYTSFKTMLSKLQAVNKDVNNLVDLSEEELNLLGSNGFLKISEILLLKSYKINIKYGKEQMVDKSKAKMIIYDASKKIQESLDKLTNEEALNLSKKIENGLINLDEDDLDTLFGLVINDKELSKEEKRDLLIYVSLNLQNAIVDEYEDDYIEIDESEKGLTIEELTELFNKHNYSVSILTDENKEELLKRGNYEQMDKLLTLLDNNDINLLDNCGHNIFLEKQDNMTEILLRSNEHCTEEILSFARNYGITKEGIINF